MKSKNISGNEMSSQKKSRIPTNFGFTKTLAIVFPLVIIFLGVGGFLLGNGITQQTLLGQGILPTSPQSQTFSEGQEVTVKGIVIKNDTKRLPMDGAAILSVQTSNNIIGVLYHPGDAECINSSARKTGLALQVGETVEAFGKYSQEVIQTCDSTRYYIKKTKENFAYDFYSISALKKNNFKSGIYRTEGYIVKIYTPPSCPKGALCKINMRGNIVISEENKTLENYSFANKDLIIFTDTSKQFTLHKKYIFTIRIRDSKSTGDTINDVEILSFN